MAGWCLAHGHLVMAALLVLGFHCLLRSGELMLIRPCDILPESNRGLISLLSSKSGVRNNSRESVAIYDPVSLELARSMVSLQSSFGMQRVSCWTRSGTAFGNLFREVLSQLGLAALGFRPYSLRRGGATYKMQLHGLMEKTSVRGRWKNSNFARLYICDGLSLLRSLQMSWESKHKVASFSSIFIDEHHAYTGGKRGKNRKSDLFG